jgi:DnaJ-class molecular chaperone
LLGIKTFLPDKRLAAVLQDEAAASSSDLERTYIPVLNQLNVSKSKSDSEQLLKEFQDIVGVIVLLATPLSIFAVAELTGISMETITNRLNRFHSVLSIPNASDKPVRILHLSFRDFLVNTTSIFRVDEAETHCKIALHCFASWKTASNATSVVCQATGHKQSILTARPLISIFQQGCNTPVGTGYIISGRADVASPNFQCFFPF